MQGNKMQRNKMQRNKTRHLMNKALTSMLLLACLQPLLTADAAAAFEDYLTERWYQVEIAVFARRSIGDDNTLERLSDPQPARLAANLGAFTGYPSVPLDAETRRMLRRTQDLAQPIEPTVFELPEVVPTIDPTSGQTIEPDPLDVFLEAVTAYENHLRSHHLHFHAGEQPRLTDELARLARRRNFQLVWGGHWLQAVPARNAAQPLHLRGGQEYGERSELEGSISVGVGRYLHLGLDLWYHDPAFSQQAALPPAQPTEPEQGLQTPLGESMSPVSTALEPLPELPRPEPVQMDSADVFTPRYMYLNAKRRMRSGDLHYIDHPKFGVLVRIDRLDTPEPLLELFEALEASQ